mmetsp:Transcript_15044/g.18871  ORF Transcript_15044/g.18871 Transcript_15044/m.18871 type:complete len:844 (+) Transcript_15044:72-2603(+)
MTRHYLSLLLAFQSLSTHAQTDEKQVPPKPTDNKHAALETNEKYGKPKNPAAVVIDDNDNQYAPALQLQIRRPADLNCGDNIKGTVSRPCMCGLINDWEPPDLTARLVSSAAVTCADGSAGGNYPCHNVDLLSFIPLATLNSAGGGYWGHEANDCWGWTDPGSGREFAIIGVESGTAYVEITDPVNPVYVGKLLSHNGGTSMWGDIKVYNNHAYIVTENFGQGMQILELTQLKSVAPGSVLTETAHYNRIGNAHNVAINEETGFGYIVGSGTCSGGLHMINLSNPVDPSFVGCFSNDGYTHDVQCVIYNGSDGRYVGKEICFAFNEDTVTIIDVSSKSNPIQLSRKSYDQVRYTHQGWLTDDHDYLLIGDELDEQSLGLKTTTIVLNVKDLTGPEVAGTHTAATRAIDHNMYIKGNYVYQANYRAGLRILGLDGVGDGTLNEVAFFDIYPNSDTANFNGAWSTYPFFNSGSILVSGIEQGLFVLRASIDNPPPTNPPPTNPFPTPTAPPPTNPPPTNPPPTPTVPPPTRRPTNNPPPTTECSPGEQEITITILTDNYPSETTWELTEECGTSKVLKRGGPWGDAGVKQTSHCVAANKEYKFTINDVYGDGICCSYGNGYYEITFDGKTIRGDQFTTSESQVLGSCADTPAPTAVPTTAPTSSNTNSTGPNDWEVIFFDDFEVPNNWGHFKRRGARRHRNKHVRSGMASIAIRSGPPSPLAFMESNGFGVSDYDEIEVDFFFKPMSIEANEGLALEYNKGAGWVRHRSWMLSIDFVNRMWHEGLEYIPIHPEDTSMAIRFVCLGQGQRDKIFIDDVDVTGVFKNGFRAEWNSSDWNSTLAWEDV